MSLNECLPGPASGSYRENPTHYHRLYDAYDRFQVAFRERLIGEGIEAVAFNFAAGNFGEPAHYLDFFPRTLAAYTYLDRNDTTTDDTLRCCASNCRPTHPCSHRPSPLLANGGAFTPLYAHIYDATVKEQFKCRWIACPGTHGRSGSPRSQRCQPSRNDWR